MARGIWVRLVKSGKVLDSRTVECEHADWESALTEACHALDLQKPVVLPRHERDFSQFNQARFLPEHFVESVSFDRMEVEYIDPEAKKAVNERYL